MSVNTYEVTLHPANAWGSADTGQPGTQVRITAANGEAALVQARARLPGYTPTHAHRLDDVQTQPQPIPQPHHQAGGVQMGCRQYEIHIPHDKGTTTVSGTYRREIDAITDALDAAIAAGGTWQTRKIIVASKAVAA